MQARVTLSDFDCICILGHGGFGKVFASVLRHVASSCLTRAMQVLQVQLKGTNKMFAMKVRLLSACLRHTRC